MAFADNFIRSYMAGQQVRQQKEQRESELEDRADRRKLMTLRIKQEEMQDKLAARNESIQNAQLMQGQPGRNPIQAGVEAQLPSTPSSPVVPLEQQETPHKPVMIPGAFGSEGVSIQPQTRGELRGEKMKDLLDAMHLKQMDYEGKAAIDSRKREDEQAFQMQKQEEMLKASDARQDASIAASDRRQTAQLASTERRHREDIASREKIAEQRERNRKLIAEAAGTGIDKPLSAEGAKVFSIATTGAPELELLKQAFMKDHKGTLIGILSGTDRNLSKLVDQAADKVGRLRSGGAVNKDEEARFKRQIASWMDLPFGKQKDAIAALDGYTAEFSSVANSMDPSGERRKRQGMGGATKPAADPLGLFN